MTVTATTLGPMIAHAGPGHTWQAMVVLAGFMLMGTLLVAAAGRITMDKPDDLVMPLAVIAVASSLAPMASELLSDAIGAGLPLGVIALVALLLAALSPLEIRLPAPLPMGALALAVVATVMLYQPLTIALHPPADVLPLADDSEVTITTPEDGATVDAGQVEVAVEVTGGSIGPGGVPLDQLPDDPEEAGALAVAIQPVADDDTTTTQQRVDVSFDRTCTVDDPCSEVAFTLDLDPGTHRVTVEFTRGDDVPFATNIRDRVTFTAE